MRGILFITRKWRGRGGMQQWSRDFWSEMQEQYRGQAALCALQSFWDFPLFLLCVLIRGGIAVLRGWHIHLGDCALLPLGWIFAMFGASVSVTAHGLDVLYPRRWYQRMFHCMFKRAKKIACVSRATATQVYARGGKEGQVVVIPCGIRGSGIGHRTSDIGPRASAKISLFRSPNPAVRIPNPKVQSPRLLSVCRLIPRKGIAWFTAEVVMLLKQEFPLMEYMIVGTGPEEKLIKKIVQERGLEDTVHRVGDLSDPSRDMLYRACDVLVVPNVPVPGDMEGFGIVCIEAASWGLPVAAAKIEGIADAVFPGVTGAFFDPGDVSSAAAAIRQILSHPLDRGKILEAARAHFSWRTLFLRYQHEVFS